MDPLKENAQHSLQRGNKFPYDASDVWWKSVGLEPPPPIDRAHYVARGVLAELNDRSGIHGVLDQLDEDVRKELTEAIADIIRIGLENENV